MLMDIRNFIVTFIVFILVDLIWLGLIAKNLYSKHLGFIMSDKVNWPAAILFYFIFIIGLLVFVITPAKSVGHALLLGAFFGFVTYATYDLTNLATLKDWPIIITVIDLIWGTVLAASTSSISYIIIDKLGK